MQCLEIHVGIKLISNRLKLCKYEYLQFTQKIANISKILSFSNYIQFWQNARKKITKTCTKIQLHLINTRNVWKNKLFKCIVFYGWKMSLRFQWKNIIVHINIYCVKYKFTNQLRLPQPPYKYVSIWIICIFEVNYYQTMICLFWHSSFKIRLHYEYNSIFVR